MLEKTASVVERFSKAPSASEYFQTGAMPRSVSLPKPAFDQACAEEQVEMFLGILVAHAGVPGNRRDLFWFPLNELKDLQPEGICENLEVFG